MQVAAKDHQIWFLTGSQGLYGQDTLRQVADQSQQIQRALDASDLTGPRSCGSRC